MNIKPGFAIHGLIFTYMEFWNLNPTNSGGNPHNYSRRVL